MESQPFSWSEMGLSIILMIVMAFFCTGGVEVFKDIFYYWLLTWNNIANRFRVVKRKITEEDKYFSETTSKAIAFGIALWMCFVFDYGAIAKIVQYGVKARGTLAMFTDYVLTASIIRLGAVQVYDVLAMLTEKAVAAKALAQKLMQSPPQNTETITKNESSSVVTEKSSTAVVAQEPKQ